MTKEMSLQHGDTSRNETAPLALNRRSFLRIGLASGTGVLLSHSRAFADIFTFFQPLTVNNPLTSYPNRGWERVYRDLYRFDSSFVFLCAPNDTHNCLLRAHVKNGVAVRIAPTFGFGKATDLYGNQASHRWDPRCCQKGLALGRRFYGDRRCKYPLVRRGYLDWVQAGFPRDPKTGRPPEKYFQRGKDHWVKVDWGKIFDITAQSLKNIAETYSGPVGMERLRKQGYDEAMVEATRGAGVQTIKFRGGMPPLGATRIFAQYRLANMMALLDAQIRKVGPEQALGARGWDNYSWHTDLPPGHPMVTGQQTVDWDLVAVENARLVIVWGMNWITTKMPDAHWLTEARLKGSKIVVIAAEYSATASKADAVLIVRPGTTPALALGFCHVLLKEKLYDAEYVKRYTDLPLLVRMDTLQLLRATDLQSDYQLAPLQNYLRVVKAGESVPPFRQDAPMVSEKLRQEWGDFVVWDQRTNRPVPLSRDETGKGYDKKGIDAALEGTFTATLADGKQVEVRPVFDLLQTYVLDNFDPATVEEITWAPREGIIHIAREIGANKDQTLFAMGMGPNQFFNNDLKDRTVFFLAALTRNIGKVGGNVGSYAGNYRAAFFNGLPQYIAEDPFSIELDPQKPIKVKGYFTPESVHYFNHGDTVLRMGKKLLTGQTHLPTPTKAIHVSNSNSLIGNAKGHYDTVMNVLPKVEFIAVNEWWWTASCEYADVVFPVDSWAEFKYADLTISVTNPFLYVFPRTPLPRIFNTRSDIEVAAGIGKAMARLTGDTRFQDYWSGVLQGDATLYLQRLLDQSNATRGYRIEELEKQAQEGIPALLLSRTYPKIAGWEQANEDKPWYTKTGRVEFYREEPEFRESGENIPIFREPVDSTFYEPNVIVGKPHPAIRPTLPEDYGVSSDDLSGDIRQARHVRKTWEEVKKTRHPLTSHDPAFRFIFHTPKYRHSAHTTPIDTDVVAIWFGPFGDIYRKDTRKPFVTEAYMDINPLDAKELGIEDGDYIWVDADPEDRPYRGWKPTDEAYRVARLLCRARYYPGTPRGVTRMWHNMYGATFGSVQSHITNPSGLAKNPETGYQAIFRFGSHQSCTRGWLKPTLMTDTLVRKGLFGQMIGKGFVPDVHCPTGAPRESFVKISFAEPGGIEGKRLWRPAELGLTPTYESAAMKRYLQGAYIKV